MIKLIVSDLDGTLLNGAHVIDEESIKAIRAAQQLGIEFMIATGRHYESVKPMLDVFDMKCRCILLNGSVLQNEEGEIEKSIAIDRDCLIRVVEILEFYKINLHFYTKDGTSAKNPEALRTDFVERIKSQDHLSNEEVEHILATNNFCNFDILIHDYPSYFADNPVIYKLEAFCNDDELMMKVRSELAEIPEIEITNSIGNNFELTNAKAQKGLMLEILCEELGYTKDEVIVFGDSMNDYSMMKLFPNSCAMENSCPQILEAASHVIGKNSELGVAHKINEIVAIQKGQID